MTERSPLYSDWETRRPGIIAILEEVQAEHPNWPIDRIESTAKELWTVRNTKDR